MAASKDEKHRRKFVVIAKVSKDHFVKYRCNDLNRFFTGFLFIKYPGALYANVFSNKGQDKRKLVYTYGKLKGLQPAYK